MTDFVCAGWGFRGLDLAEFFAAAMRLGIPAVEISYMAAVPKHLPLEATIDQAREVQTLAARAGVRIPVLGASNDFALADRRAWQAEVDRVKRAADLAVALGGRIVRVFAGHCSPEEDEEAAYARIVEGLKEAGAYAESRGVRLALENHNGLTATGKRVQRILERVKSPAVGANYDPGNFYRWGEDPLVGLEAIAPYVVYTHWKDCRRGHDGFEFCAVGEGEIEWPPILERLKALGYQGLYGIEYEEPGDIERGTRDSVTYLKRYL